LQESNSNAISHNTVKGWLLDLYPSNRGEITLWFISETGQRLKLTDKYLPKIYVAGDEYDLWRLTKTLAEYKPVTAWGFTKKYANLSDTEKSKVLEITIADHRDALYLAQKILKLGYEALQLGNVDIPDAQAYLYDRDIFPLAFMAVSAQDGRLTYHLLDSVESENYTIPPLRFLWVGVEIAKVKKIPSFKDPIAKIELKGYRKETVIDGGDEQEKLLTFVRSLKEADPDIIFTYGGDYTLLPYLATRASLNGVSEQFILGREPVPLAAKLQTGTTFFSYGRIYFKAPMRRLFGRVHIDVQNTFIYE